MGRYGYTLRLRCRAVRMGARRGERSLPPGKFLKKKSLKEKMYKRSFNLQKAPIVCYAKKFPHKRPPCYVLNTQKGLHVMR